MSHRKQRHGSAKGSTRTVLAKAKGAVSAPPPAKTRRSKFDDEIPVGQIMRVPTSSVMVDPDQPRKFFDKIPELAASIKQEDQISAAIVVRVSGKGPYRYKLVDGERRLRACKLANIESFLVRIVTEEEAKKILAKQISANFQRQDHTPMETAFSMRNLLGKGYKVKEISVIFGRVESSVYQHLSLTRLHKEVQRMIEPNHPEGKSLKFTLALKLVTLPQDKQLECALAVAGKDFSYSAARSILARLVNEHSDPNQQKRGRRPKRESDIFFGAMNRAWDQFNTWGCHSEDEIKTLTKGLSGKQYRELLRLLRETRTKYEFLSKIIEGREMQEYHGLVQLAVPEKVPATKLRRPLTIAAAG